jgi:hypothetical protein
MTNIQQICQELGRTAPKLPRTVCRCPKTLRDGVAIPSYEALGLPKEKNGNASGFDGRHYCYLQICHKVGAVRVSRCTESLQIIVTAQPAWSVPGTQFGSWSLQRRVDIRLSESTENALHQFQVRQVVAGRGLVLRTQL